MDLEAVDTAMEAKPALDTKEEIWNVMLERFNFEMHMVLAKYVVKFNFSLNLNCRVAVVV